MLTDAEKEAVVRLAEREQARLHRPHVQRVVAAAMRAINPRLPEDLSRELAQEAVQYYLDGIPHMMAQTFDLAARIGCADEKENV